MDLKSGLPFSLIKNGLVVSYPKLEDNKITQVVIIGGGISGALMAYHLIKKNISCIVLDARSIGLGSTCASTSLLQYEIDMPLYKLAKNIGVRDAVRSYQLCQQALEKLFMIAEDIKFTGIQKKESLYYAAFKKDIPGLQLEYAMRKKKGFRVKYYDSEALYAQTGIRAPAGIISADAGQTDAYLFTHALHQYNIRKGVEVFDRAPACRIEQKNQGIEVRTENGCCIKAKQIVYATGYESVNYIKEKIGNLYSTYAIVSEELTLERPFWKKEMLIWNTANPYLYLRTTEEGRILIGGRDENFYSPAKRDKLIPKKTKQLTKDFQKLFPHIRFIPEFSWAGTFISTKDGLPFIDAYKALPNSYFALGFGGNGITFSLVAAEIIADILTGKNNPDRFLFSFDRH